MNFLLIASLCCSTLSYGMQLGTLVKSSSSVSAIVGQTSAYTQSVKPTHVLRNPKKTGVLVVQRQFTQTNPEKLQTILIDLAWKNEFDALSALIDKIEAINKLTDKHKFICTKDKIELEEALVLEREGAHQTLGNHAERSRKLLLSCSAAVASTGAVWPLWKGMGSALHFWHDIGGAVGSLGFGPTFVMGSGAISAAVLAALMFSGHASHILLFDDAFIPCKKVLVQDKIKKIDALQAKIKSMNVEPK